MKKTIFFSLISIIISLFFLSSCRPVLFDRNIALDAYLISKMTKIADLGTMSINSDYCFGESDYKVFFLPDKNILNSNYRNSGFICIDNKHDLFIWYRNEDGYISGQQHQFLYNEPDNEPHYLLEPIVGIDSGDIVDTAEKRLLFLNFHTSDNSEYEWNSFSRYNILEYSNGNTQWRFSSENEGADLESKIAETIVPYIIGGITLSSDDHAVKGAYIDPSLQLLTMLYMLTDPNLLEPDYRYYDILCAFTFTAPPNQIDLIPVGPLYTYNGTIRYNTFDSRIYKDFYYYYDYGNEESFISYQPKNESDYITYNWNNTLASGSDEELNKIELSYNVPIHAYLSTSEFLSYKDNSVTVYDKNGKKLNSFETGNLRYTYEMKDPNTKKNSMIFVYCNTPPTYDCSNIELSISIYSYPTADIDEL